MKRPNLLIFVLTLTTMSLFAQKKDQSAVAEAVKQLNNAMVDANQIKLDELSSEKLSYGHSSGLVEDKHNYITNIIDGTLGFTSIDLTDQTISISGDVAIVRHKFQDANDDKGKAPGRSEE